MGARYELLANLRSAVMSGTNAQTESMVPFPMSLSPTESLMPTSHISTQVTMLPASMADGQGNLVAMRFPASGGLVGERVTFPVIDNSSLGEPFYDESVSTVMDFGLWEEGFADPAMDASFDFTQWTQTAGMTQADDRMDV